MKKPHEMVANHVKINELRSHNLLRGLHIPIKTSKLCHCNVNTIYNLIPLLRIKINTRREGQRAPQKKQNSQDTS
jgi:hypothetical protein